MMAPLEPTTIPVEFSELPFSEQLVLWATRIWVRALKTETNAQGLLRTGFQRVRAPEARPALDDLLTIIAVSAQCDIDVRSTTCKSVSPDEQSLMGAIAAWQSHASVSVADSFLGAWMPPSAVRLARTPTAQLATALKDVGLTIRYRKPNKVRAPHEASEELGESRAVTIH